MTKYRAKPTTVDGYRFASKKEANRYQQLLWMHEANEIEDLQLQPRFDIEVNGVKVCKYYADFKYRDKRTGDYVIEDVKGVRTAIYKLKKKLVQAVHGIDIVEV